MENVAKNKRFINLQHFTTFNRILYRTYEEEIRSFLKDYGNGYNDSNQCGMHNWIVHTGMILDVTKNGTWIGEFVNEKGELFYYTYNKNTKIKKLYRSKKAKVRLMQQGLNDEAYVS